MAADTHCTLIGSLERYKGLSVSIMEYTSLNATTSFISGAATRPGYAPARQPLRQAPVLPEPRQAAPPLENAPKVRPSSGNPLRFGRGLIVGLVVGLAVVMSAILVPSLIGFKPMVVMSGSMEPALSAGDIAVVRPVDGTQLELGDVITYQSGTKLVTHRVVGVNIGPSGPSYVLQGDANTVADRVPIDPEMVVGKVIYRIPRVGSIISFANSGMGRMALFALPILGMVLLGLRKRKHAAQTTAEQAPAANVESSPETMVVQQASAPTDECFATSSPLSPIVTSFIDEVMSQNSEEPAQEPAARRGRVIPSNRIRTPLLDEATSQGAEESPRTPSIRRGRVIPNSRIRGRS